MRRSSKLISLLLVVCMVFALTVTAFAAEASMAATRWKRRHACEA